MHNFESSILCQSLKLSMPACNSLKKTISKQAQFFGPQDSNKSTDLRFKDIDGSNYETGIPVKEGSGSPFNRPTSFGDLPPPPPYVSHSSGTQPQYYSSNQVSRFTLITSTLFYFRSFECSKSIKYTIEVV